MNLIQDYAISCAFKENHITKNGLKKAIDELPPMLAEKFVITMLNLEPPTIERTEINQKITLVSNGQNKLYIIKTLEEVLNIGLKDAKDISDAAPVDITSYVVSSCPEGTFIKEWILHVTTALEGNGATVKIA